MSTNNELYSAVINHWGIDHQVNKTIEEAAELIQALCHFRDSKIALPDLIDEIADIQIMSEQMALLFGEEAVALRKKIKIRAIAGFVALITKCSI
jgi:NTP pyrophosphatase (non-canonical NTP hydrolase)